MISVKATREGLVGKLTASGYVIDKVVPFIALPSTLALYKFVRLTNPVNNKSCIAIVLDVGPWNISDNDYVFQPATDPNHNDSIKIAVKRPAAETSHGTNQAGIDLSEKVWSELDMKDNGPIYWEFLE